MKQQYYLQATPLFLLFFLTFTTCQVQPIIKKAVPKPSSSTPTPPFKDPLFFIEGQLCQHVRKIFQDSKGNLWLGTNIYDLMLYNGDTLRYLTEKEGFGGGRVTGIAEDKEGVIWFSTAHGLNKYEGGSFTLFSEKEGLANSELWSLLLDSKGIIWVGHNEGFSSFDGKKFKNLTAPKIQAELTHPTYIPDRITAIVEDKQGHLWLGTGEYGICYYNGQSFTQYTTKDGLADNAIYDLLIDSKGELWIGTFWGGLSRFDGKNFTNYTKDGIISGVEVSGLFEDTNGDIWFGVENQGVYKYDGKTFTNLYKEAGLDSSILSIYRDQEGRFWFGGWGGLFRYNGQTFSSVTKNGPWK